MRSKLSKSVKYEFDLRLKNDFPYFEDDTSEMIPKGCKGYTWKINDNIWAYILLVFSPKDDSFTVEIAWTKTKNFPAYTFNLPYENSERENSRFRLSQLIDVKSDYWWYLGRRKTLDDDLFVPDEDIKNLLPKVKPLVDDAIQKIRHYAIPYLKSLEDK